MTPNNVTSLVGKLYILELKQRMTIKKNKALITVNLRMRKKINKINRQKYYPSPPRKKCERNDRRKKRINTKHLNSEFCEAR